MENFVDTSSHKVYNNREEQSRDCGFAFFTIREEKIERSNPYAGSYKIYGQY